MVRCWWTWVGTPSQPFMLSLSSPVWREAWSTDPTCSASAPESETVGRDVPVSDEKRPVEEESRGTGGGSSSESAPDIREAATWVVQRVGHAAITRLPPNVGIQEAAASHFSEDTLKAPFRDADRLTGRELRRRGRVSLASWISKFPKAVGSLRFSFEKGGENRRLDILFRQAARLRSPRGRVFPPDHEVSPTQSPGPKKMSLEKKLKSFNVGVQISAEGMPRLSIH